MCPPLVPQVSSLLPQRRLPSVRSRWAWSPKNEWWVLSCTGRDCSHLIITPFNMTADCDLKPTVFKWTSVPSFICLRPPRPLFINYTYCRLCPWFSPGSHSELPPMLQTVSRSSGPPRPTAALLPPRTACHQPETEHMASPSRLKRQK